MRRMEIEPIILDFNASDEAGDGSLYNVIPEEVGDRPLTFNNLGSQQGTFAYNSKALQEFFNKTQDDIDEGDPYKGTCRAIIRNLSIQDNENGTTWNLDGQEVILGKTTYADAANFVIRMHDSGMECSIVAYCSINEASWDPDKVEFSVDHGYWDWELKNSLVNLISAGSPDNLVAEGTFAGSAPMVFNNIWPGRYRVSTKDITNNLHFPDFEFSANREDFQINGPLCFSFDDLQFCINIEYRQGPSTLTVYIYTLEPLNWTDFHIDLYRIA